MGRSEDVAASHGGTVTVTGITTSAQIGFEETSTHSPSFTGANGEKGIGAGRYPFVEPSTDYERRWWDEMRRMAREGGPTTQTDLARQLKTWAPVIRLMTPAERQKFHAQRQDMVGSFVFDIDSVRGESERQVAEERLFAEWSKRTYGRG